MELTTNDIAITDAIKFVQNKTDHLNNVKKELLHDIKKEQEDNKMIEEGEDKQQQETNNDIF